MMHVYRNGSFLLNSALFCTSHENNRHLLEDNRKLSSSKCSYSYVKQVHVIFKKWKHEIMYFCMGEKHIRWGHIRQTKEE